MAMKITRKSELTGIERTFDINVTQEQLNNWQYNNVLLQNAFPQLSRGDREFIKSGITTEEWDTIFEDEE